MNRIQPALATHSMKTYAIDAPRDTHFRDASCDQVGCTTMASGWETYVDEATPLGQRQAHYIRRSSGRSFTEARNEHGVTVFTFPAGESCFVTHQVRVDRPEFYIVRGGDWRGNPRGDFMEHSTPDSWVDDFATHQEGLAKAQE